MERIFSSCFAVMLLSAAGLAAERRVADPAPRDNPPTQPLDIFQAIDDGQVDVKFIPIDAAAANVLIENKTDRLLQIALPEAFAAIPLLGKPLLEEPVLGQLGPQFGQPAANAGGGGGAASQSVGGGFNAGGNQGLGNQGLGNPPAGGGRQGVGLGFGLLRIPAQKTRKLTATTVCLEFGKPDPLPRLAYRMIPLSQFSQDDRIGLLCKQLGQGEIPQNSAQAAAWHLANHLSWDEISQINRIESRYVGNIKMFSPSELQKAQDVLHAIKATLRNESKSDDD